MVTTGVVERPKTIRGLPRMLARSLEAYQERLDVDAVRTAYELAEEAHSGQRRASGEPFINHAVEVAAIIADFRLDTATVVSALVHDVVEDTVVSLQGIRELFGDEVAMIVDGVTKIGKVRYRTSTDRQVGNYRKLLVSMARDARVILVKLADRLHNMRTLEHLSPRKQQEISRETRDIYAPMAHRLGMAMVKWELEDLSFKFLDAEAYAALRKLVRQRRRARERRVLRMQRPLEDALAVAGIGAEVTGRPKHLWSIHRKMVGQGLEYDEIYDLMALRIITDTVQDCYAALGVVHGRWTPIQERFHDYVATPKSNMYQSIHTTVSGEGGRRYEIQIRTKGMHKTAELGIAAHWNYKEDGKRSRLDESLNWTRQALEWEEDASENDEFMKSLALDLYQGEIFVFTPRGEVKQLPKGSTPIDFAFAVHTEIGLHCAGAKIDGRIAPLSRELRSGQSIEIVTHPRQRPSRDWLGFVKTARARTRIRQWVRREEYKDALALGRRIFERELRKSRRPKPSDVRMTRGARKLNYKSFEDVLAGLGEGRVGPATVIKCLYPDEDPSEVVQRSPSSLERIHAKLRKSNTAIAIQGVENLMARYSQCCRPVPGDEVTGYLTRGRGVSIHRNDCPNLLELAKDADRRVEIRWQAESEDVFLVHIALTGNDRRGLLGDVGRTISQTATNIQSSSMGAEDGSMTAKFVVEVQDRNHLNRVLKAVRRVKGVTSAKRIGTFTEQEWRAP